MIIDNIDISTYSAKLLQGSLQEVLEYPKLKKVNYNDWAEYDGLEVDLTSPLLNTKDIVLSLLISESSIDSFINFLLLKTYRVYFFKGLNQSFKLRFLEISNIEKTQGKCLFKLKLADDFPLKDYVYVAPNLTAKNYGFTLDGVNLYKYGLIPLQGTKDSLEGSIKAKSKLEIQSNYISGVKVAEQVSKKQENKATLNLFIKQSTSNFFKGYKAFLYHLIQSDARVLIAHGITYNCYYESSKITDLIVLDGIVWCKFSVNIIVI